jgi:8-oxo-dGTP pyrophosphatase MutT (NUDIX family)
VYDLPDVGPSLLYTQRATTLRRHPGEVSFPGGRVDPGDLDPLAAALRETQEEVGVAPGDVEVLGHLTDYLTFHDVLICAYVAAPRGPPPSEPLSREEVARVFTVPVADLLARETYEARRMPQMPRERQVHYWHVEPQTIWGVTGELTARFLQRAFGWRPPHAPRVIHDPAGFRPGR